MPPSRTFHNDTDAAVEACRRNDGAQFAERQIYSIVACGPALDREKLQVKIKDVQFWEKVREIVEHEEEVARAGLKA